MRRLSMLGRLSVYPFRRTLLCGTSLLFFGSMLSTPSVAADGDAIETVVITGVRESLRDSLEAKKNSLTITENISTKDIGQLPDVTIAEELNRLPGFNTSLDRGNASQASVRGLGPRYVLGLVNGREVASSEPSQDVRWEIYPSEIVSAAAVSKSQSADLIEGGIAATIDIKTRSPLDYTGSSFTASITPNYSQSGENLPHYSPWGLRGSASFVEHISDNLAFYVAGSFQRQKNGYAWFRGWGYNEVQNGNAGDITGDGKADATAWGAQTDISMLQQDRFALTGAVEWKPISSLRIRADILYSDYRIHDNQLQAWYNGWGNWTGAPAGTACDAGTGGAVATEYGCSASSSTNDNVTIRNNVVVAGKMTDNWGMVNNAFAVYGEQHNLLVAGLNAEYAAGNWDLKADVSHSEAQRHNNWKDVVSAVWPENVTYDTARSDTPSVSFSGSGASDVSDPTKQVAYGSSQMGEAEPERLLDHLSTMQLDAARTFNGSFLTSISFGARVSEREKHHVEWLYYLCPGSGSTLSSTCSGSATLPSDLLKSFTVHGIDVPDMLYGNYDKLAKVVYPDGTDNIPGSEEIGDRWTVHTNNYEGYVKADFASQLFGIPFEGNIGVRVVGTFVKSSGFETADSGSTYDAISVSKSYTDALPSLNMIFHLTDDQYLRLGAALAMSRPPLDELRTGYSLHESTSSTSGLVTRYGSGGNPKLNPYRSSQADVSYEWYFDEESLLAIAGYYKHLNSFIGYNDKYQTIDGDSYEIYSPVNGKGGDVEGLETTFQTRFSFVPVKFLQDFGIYANYAYVHSKLKEYTPTWNPLDATGLAKHTSEIDLWYNAHQIEARIAYKLTSPYTIAYTWDGSALTRTDWHRNLDFSISYKFDQHLGVNFYASNLTKSVWRSYYDNNPEELARYDMYGRTFSLCFYYYN